MSKNFKKLVGVILCLAIALTMVMPMSAFAAGEDEFTLNCQAVDTTANTATFPAPGDVTTVCTITNGTVADGNKLLVAHDDIHNLVFAFDSSFDKDTMDFKVTDGTDDGFRASLDVNDNNEATIPDSVNLPTGAVFQLEPKQQDDGPGYEEFDGRAYFVWASDDKLCYHLFEELMGRTDDEMPLNIIKASEVTDQSGNNIAYVFGQDMADWVLARDFEDAPGHVKYTNADITTVLGDGRDDHGITLNPCGAESTDSAINTNGDMNFRASIIKDGYEALAFMADEEELEYFPGFLNGIFNSSTVDISGSTKNSPATYTAYLLEKTVKFNTAEASKSPIVSVKALDVNPAAVSIADKGNGEFEITFNSNFYDRVVFELKDEDGNTYYIRIARSLMDAQDNFGPDTTDPKVTALVYFPADMSKDDFDVVANIVFDDGTERTEIAKSSIIGFLNGQDFDDYEADAGKNIKVAAYSVDVTKSVTNVYFTVVYKGALDGNTYGGTFGGSGKGFNYDLEERAIIFD